MSTKRRRWLAQTNLVYNCDFCAREDFDIVTGEECVICGRHGCFVCTGMTSGAVTWKKFEGEYVCPKCEKVGAAFRERYDKLIEALDETVQEWERAGKAEG